MSLLLKRRWSYLIPALLGLVLVLLAVFAVQIGIDHNAAWGTRRWLCFVLGVILLLASIPLYAWRRSPKAAEAGSTARGPHLVPIAAGIFLVAVLVAYVWFVSLGRWTVWLNTGAYYDRLAAAFRQGHLNIDSPVAASLASLQNPYDPDSRTGIQGVRDIWDMSFYNGRIYLYFGPAPALLLAAVKWFYPGQVGDAAVTFAFISGLFVFEALLILWLRRILFPAAAAWTVLLGLLVTGLAHPVLWILTLPRIYEEAVAAGQFFLVGGYFFALTGLSRYPARLWHWVLAGSFWVFAVGTRAILLLPVLFLTIMVLYQMRSEAGGLRRFVRAFLALLLPMAVGALAIGWYNWARFGSVVELGLRYQIGFADLNTNYASTFSAQHIAPNLYNYLINPPYIRHLFPFIRPVRADEIISAAAGSSALAYNAEAITGIFYSTPFILLAIIPVAAEAARLVRGGRAAPPSEEAGRHPGLLRWIVVSMAGSCLLALTALSFYFYGTVRYLLEITPFALLLAVIGFWQADQFLRRRPALHIPFVIITSILATAAILAGLLLAFSSDVDWIRSNNPGLLPGLTRFFLGLFRGS